MYRLYWIADRFFLWWFERRLRRESFPVVYLQQGSKEPYAMVVKGDLPNGYSAIDEAEEGLIDGAWHWAEHSHIDGER